MISSCLLQMSLSVTDFYNFNEFAGNLKKYLSHVYMSFINVLTVLEIFMFILFQLHV